MTQYTGKTKILLNTTGSNGCSTELTETCEDFVVPAAAILEEEPAAQSNAGGNSVENGVSGQGEDTEGQYTGRVAAREDLDAQIGEWTRGYTKRQAMRILQANGVPAAAKYTGEDLYSDVHFRQRGHVVDVHEPPWGDLSHQGLPGIPALSEAHGDGPPPWIGAHNDYVFKTLLGLNDGEYNAAQESGAIR